MATRTSDEKRKRALQIRSDPDDDVTQADAALRLGLSQPTISRIEIASGKPPKASGRTGRPRRRSFYGQATSGDGEPSHTTEDDFPKVDRCVHGVMLRDRCARCRSEASEETKRQRERLNKSPGKKLR